ncbi:hypothetical protein AALG83_05045 [Christensenellaceae bacterium 44-20]
MNLDLEELLELLESVFPQLALDYRPKQQRLALTFKEVKDTADFSCYVYQLYSDLDIIRFALERGVGRKEIKETLTILHVPAAVADDMQPQEHEEKREYEGLCPSC